MGSFPIDDAATRILAFAKARGSGRTCCPSEIARALTPPGADWRDQMDMVHTAARHLQRDGGIVVSWKGQPRMVGDGPYRIGVVDD